MKKTLRDIYRPCFGAEVFRWPLKPFRNWILRNYIFQDHVLGSEVFGWPTKPFRSWKYNSKVNEYFVETETTTKLKMKELERLRETSTSESWK